MAGFVDDGDGVSSLARLEAADEVWEIAATLQSTKRRHRRPPSSSPVLVPRPLRSTSHPRVSSLALSSFLLAPTFYIDPAEFSPPLSPSSFLVGGDNSSSASAHTSGLIPLQPPPAPPSHSLSLSLSTRAPTHTRALRHTYTLGRARGAVGNPTLTRAYITSRLVTHRV